MSGDDPHTGPARPTSDEDDGLDHPGVARVDAELDGFHQPTALFDKGQFLGDLADLVEGSPETRAQVQAADPPPRGCRLIVVAGPDIGLEWAFKGEQVVLGRDEDCDLSLSDIAVSRRHARVAREGNGFVLEDLGSNNGTFLNGDRIEGRAPLGAGDEIVVGERTLRFVELNEAPPTSAAQPAHLREDPASSAPIESELEGVGLSQIDLRAASAAPDDAEAARSSGVGSGRGALRRTLQLGAVGLVAVVAAGAGLYLWQDRAARRAEAERVELAQRRFLQAIALVKAERFGDAQRVLTRLTEIEPQHPRAPDYIRHVEYELGQWAMLERAEALAQGRRYAEAKEVLAEVDADSAYADDAARRARAYERRMARGWLAQARAAIEGRDYDRATRLLEQALEVDPGSEEARLLLDQVASARAGERPARPQRRASSIPPVLMRSILLYRQGQLPAAIDAAVAAGTPRAEEVVEQMKSMKRLLDQAERAHRLKAAAELLDLVPRALDLDKEIGGGEGELRGRFTRFFADGLYLEGIEALQERDEPRAYSLFTEALRKWPRHELANRRLGDLEGRARALYYEARSAEEVDPERARKLYERLTQMTPATNSYHRLAKTWLRRR